jgi:hypothetical protein
MQNWKYIFNMDDGRRHEFDVTLDDKTMQVIPLLKGTPPDWTLLEFHKCDNCPLPYHKKSWCPIAVNVALMVNGFDGVINSSNAHVVVVNKERTVSRHVPIASGLYSLLGIYMAASGCPVMSKLRPMAYYHLPFSTVEETIYRVLTMYVTGQYFRDRKGLAPDWKMEELRAMYGEIRTVNQCFAERIRAAAEKDVVINSLVSLDVFAMAMTDITDHLGDMRKLFGSYLDNK